MLATMLAVAAVCGPAGGVTLAQSESARVLARGGAVLRVRSFVVTGDEAVACALEPALDGNRRPGTPRIVAEGEVLDKGPGIDLASLRRRGGELVWLHDGAERTAPLLRRG